MGRNLKLLIALIIVGTIAVYVVFVTVPTQLARRSYDAAKALGDDFRKAFQFTPEVKVNNTIVLNQQAPVLELAVLSQRFEHRYVWENSWMGSTKKIFITGTFDARVGFDLNRKFSISLRDGKAFVSVPEPQTLSLESHGDMTYRDEQGIWNWVSVQDRTRATNAFIGDARKYADRAAFIQDAKTRLQERLKTVLKPYADDVVVDYATSVTTPR